MAMPEGPPLYPANPILAIDDNPEILKILELSLKSEGISNLVLESSASNVLTHLAERPFSLVLLDLRMPGVEGYDLLCSIRETYPAIPVIMITGERDLETAIRCMRHGARDYLAKPVDPRRLISSVRHALELGELREEYRTFVEKSTRDHLEQPEAFKAIITQSANMRSVFHYIETIARTRKPVLITGESGVGKELIARAVHDLSGVAGPYVSETVAGYDDTMFSDALFGHVPGAFTGAGNRRPGLVENAGDGTLFLDEIGDLSEASQVKLLRLLQEREYRSLGADKVRRTSARFVFATNRNLAALRDEGKFRGDLFFRISTHQIEVPPLRHRRQDIAPLVKHFVSRAAGELGKEPPLVPAALYQLLNTFDFPGNVRELEAMVFDAVAKATGRSLSLDLFDPQAVKEGNVRTAHPGSEFHADQQENVFSHRDSLPTLAEAQHQLIEEAMERAGGNQGVASRILGISRSALNKRLHQGER